MISIICQKFAAVCWKSATLIPVYFLTHKATHFLSRSFWTVN